MLSVQRVHQINERENATNGKIRIYLYADDKNENENQRDKKKSADKGHPMCFALSPFFVTNEKFILNIAKEEYHIIYFLRVSRWQLCINSWKQNGCESSILSNKHNVKSFLKIRQRTVNCSPVILINERINKWMNADADAEGIKNHCYRIRYVTWTEWKYQNIFDKYL